MRKPLIAGNWKMNLNSAQARELAASVASVADGADSVDVLLCPSFTLLQIVRETIGPSRALLGAQNVYWEPKGAFTGEISASMLVDAGCSHVIIGHSERRQYFGETDASVNRRAKYAMEAGLIPVICVGETLDERKEELTEKVIEHQISGALEGFTPERMNAVVIAYEPVWAIGTGQTATPGQAQEIHALIRTLVASRFGKEIAGQLRILYGGSMKPDNAEELLGQRDIDGGLVGGASLKADDFNAIINAARS